MSERGHQVLMLAGSSGLIKHPQHARSRIPGKYFWLIVDHPYSKNGTKPGTIQTKSRPANRRGALDG